VAAVVAVNLASVAVRASFGAMQSTIAGQAALKVSAAGDSVCGPVGRRAGRRGCLARL
jgi:hypothetical protein